MLKFGLNRNLESRIGILIKDKNLMKTEIGSEIFNYKA